MSEGLDTPMMRQYERLKALHPDALLFFRLGDFYEMFFDDAEVGARELEITLTSRTTGAGTRVPMCGVPHHAADNYISRLAERGFKVAIGDQVEDPRQAKGLVRREVVRVVTPGTLLEPGALPEKGSHYIVGVAVDHGTGDLGLAALDYSTGEFTTRTLRRGEVRPGLADQLACLEPAEAVVQPAAAETEEVGRLLEEYLGRAAFLFRERCFRPEEARRTIQDHFGTRTLEPFGCDAEPAAAAAAGGLLAYLREMNPAGLGHIRLLRTGARGRTMALDAATRRNLELVEPLRGRAWSGPGRGLRGRTAPARSGTLLGVLDHTVTAAGGRLLRQWVLNPLIVMEEIAARQEAVAELAERVIVQDQVRQGLRGISDLERLVTRVVAGQGGPKDLVALKDSLEKVPMVLAATRERASALLRRLSSTLDPIDDLTGLIGRALVDDPPAGPKDGDLIRDGYHDEVDRLRQVAGQGREWIADMEASERARTGIKSLKIGYSRVFGYFIEVTRPNLEAVPDDYVRRQTLANAERFITSDLKEHEAAVLGAEERLRELEYSLFRDLRAAVVGHTGRIQSTAGALAVIDALTSLAEVARRHGYRCPVMTENGGLDIVGGRHPVVERLDAGEGFVPNDCRLGGEAPSFAIITGPNMAGKSTFCRQVALIVLMAHLGSFVPATSAGIGLVDRIFTRIGSSDDLSAGRSTFLVEMGETANILNHATDRSLIILDEIGRGTSTYDGLSLAWAVVEHIAARVGAITLFATHYHELTELADLLPGVANYSISVRETGEEIVFLRKVARGAVDRSYGLHVARLAGMPPAVIHRAGEILRRLESERAAVSEEAAAGRDRVDGRATASSQLVLFEPPPSDLERELAGLDVMNLTPLQALVKLQELKERVGKGRG